MLIMPRRARPVVDVQETAVQTNENKPADVSALYHGGQDSSVECWDKNIQAAQTTSQKKMYLSMSKDIAYRCRRGAPKLGRQQNAVKFIGAQP